MKLSKNSNPEPLTVSIQDAVECLGVSRTTIYELIKAGDLVPVHIGARRLIPYAQLKALVAGAQLAA